MRVSLPILTLVFMLALFPAAPASSEEANISPQLTASLMNWVSAHTGIRVNYLPRVIASRQAMVQRIGDPLRNAALARALYVPDLVVVDDEFWDEDDIRTQSFLLHELVHHAQYISGRVYPCQKAKEWEAYHLQNLWLAERGLPPAVEESWIARMAQCGGQ
jgi:hypothetical protein